ncbi:unnamed protein product, partial [Choristocarpus tenellus]
MLDSMFHPLYPSKRVACPTFKNQCIIFKTMRWECLDVIHCTVDGLTSIFSLVGKVLGVTVVGSIHTDVVKLLKEMNICTITRVACNFKEVVDSKFLESCATTSTSFK